MDKLWQLLFYVMLNPKILENPEIKEIYDKYVEDSESIKRLPDKKLQQIRKLIIEEGNKILKYDSNNTRR